MYINHTKWFINSNQGNSRNWLVLKQLTHVPRCLCSADFYKNSQVPKRRTYLWSWVSTVEMKVCVCEGEMSISQEKAENDVVMPIGALCVWERLSIRKPQLNEACHNLAGWNHMKYIWRKPSYSWIFIYSLIPFIKAFQTILERSLACMYVLNAYLVEISLHGLG